MICAPPLDPELDLLGWLQADAFACLASTICLESGLARDHSFGDAPASIAATGLAIMAHAVAAQRGFITRSEAARYVRRTLAFLRAAPQGSQPHAAGYRGFFYHFLDPQSGRRAEECELSTVDTGILIASALVVAGYFDADHPVERQIRADADALYRRVDWRWALAGGMTISHGWKPESGFLAPRWEGYSEALFLYVLALGSPTYALAKEHYAAWTATYRWVTLYGLDYLHAGPLFIHQMPQYFLDLRGVADDYMRGKGSDYAENSRRATLIQQRYAIVNPLGFRDYGANCWGITASEGPGPLTRSVGGTTREFLGYSARGVPYGPDDGTISPWVIAASLPFAADIVQPTLAWLHAQHVRGVVGYGCLRTFNATINGPDAAPWKSDRQYPLNQCPVLIMIENARTGAPWAWSRRCEALVRGLRAAGFGGGWLDQA